ncbi:MAG: DUF2142 domain-containing protein [Rhodanobacter sp.]
MNTNNRFPAATLVILSLIAICFLSSIVIIQPKQARIVLTAESSTPGSFQLYFSRDGQYTESGSSIWSLQKNVVKTITMSLPLADVGKLRIDSDPGMAEVRVCDIQLIFPSNKSSEIPASKILSRNEVSIKQLSTNCAQVISSKDASDPQAQVSFGPLMTRVAQERRAGRGAAIALALLGFFGVVLVIWLGNIKKGLPAFNEFEENIDKSAPWIYLTMALVFGCMYAFFTPPGAVPDEPAHTAKTILIRDGHLIGGGGNQVGVSLEKIQGPFSDFLNSQRHYSIHELIAQMSTPISCVQVHEDLPKSTINASPSFYVPPVIALVIACASHGTVGSFIYGGRLGNLLVSLLLTLVGIRFAYAGRWAIFVVALLPMTLYEQASLTSDSMLFGLIFCMLGLQSGLATGRIMPGRKIEWILTVLGIALAFSKPGFAWPCVGFLASYRAYRVVGRGFLWPACFVMALPWLLHIFWTLSTVSKAIPRVGVNYHQNLANLINSPSDFLSLLSRTFFGEGQDFLWTALIGRLGWLDVVLPRAAYIIAGACVIMAIFTQRGKVIEPGYKMRILVVAATVASVIMVVIPLYLYWTPHGAILVQGLQGRYFIPAIAFLLVWIGFSMPQRIRCIAKVFILFGVATVQIYALHALVVSFYG